MHVPTGLYVSGSYGYIDDKNRKAIYGANVKSKDEHWYVQAGIEQNWFCLGKTTVFGEYGLFNTGAGLNAQGGVPGSLIGTTASPNFGAGIQGGAGQLASSEVSVWGLGVNQEISAAAMDMYLSYRHFEADVNTSKTGTSVGQTKAQVQDFQAVMMGAIIRF